MIVLDANVLISHDARHFLVALARTQALTPRWSPSIVSELVEHLSDKGYRGLSPADARTRALRDTDELLDTFPEALVDAPGAQPRQSSFEDEDDEHVLRAAKLSGADAIATRDRALLDVGRGTVACELFDDRELFSRLATRRPWQMLDALHRIAGSLNRPERPCSAPRLLGEYAHDLGVPELPRRLTAALRETRPSRDHLCRLHHYLPEVAKTVAIDTRAERRRDAGPER